MTGERLSHRTVRGAFVFLMSGLVTVACAAGTKSGSSGAPAVVAPAVVPPTRSEPAPAEEPLLVRLERTSCLGACPEYVIKVTAGGLVRYDGLDAVRLHGVATRTLSPRELKQLRRAIERAGLEALPDPCCDCPVDDSSSAILTVMVAGKWRRIEDNLGCAPPTKRLRALEDAIDRIVKSVQWVGEPNERTGGLRL